MQDGRQVPEAFSWVKELRLQDAQWLYELPWSVGLPHLDLFVDHSGCVPGVSHFSLTGEMQACLSGWLIAACIQLFVLTACWRLSTCQKHMHALACTCKRLDA